METIKEKNKKNTYGLAVAYIWLIFGVLLLPLISTNATAEPPIDEKECIIYAYTESDQHYFLLESNKSAFGSNMTIKHNCPFIEVFTNGTFRAFTQLDKIIIPLEIGFNNIEIKTENQTKNISSLYIFPDRLSWEFEYLDWQNNELDYSIDELILRSKATAQQNWASILSIVVVFTLTTMVYWHLINSYIDRNFCEEVKK